MKVKWLIENYDRDISILNLKKEIEKQGMEVKMCDYHPFSSGAYDQYKDEDCVVFYGTLNLGRQLQRQKVWVPGVYCNFKNLCCLTYFSYFGKYLLNKDYTMLPMLEIQRRRDEIFDKYGVDNCIFIRPDSGAKTFTGQVIKKEELDKDIKAFANYAAKPIDEILLIVSSPKVIESEYRFVIIDKKVVTGSQYIKNGKIYNSKKYPVEAEELAFKIAQEKWQPDIAFTLDICKSDGEYHLLECNSFSCSGLYKCLLEPVVKAISEAALKEWLEYYGEK
jgi:hypothetical protein